MIAQIITEGGHRDTATPLEELKSSTDEMGKILQQSGSNRRVKESKHAQKDTQKTPRTTVMWFSAMEK